MEAGVKGGAGEKRLSQSFPGVGDQPLLLTGLPAVSPSPPALGAPAFT